MQDLISTGRRLVRSAERQTILASTARRSNMPQATAATQHSGHPAWVLLNTTARIGCCGRNETTAEAKTSDGHDIVVSFSVTDPLALSQCFVHCPDLAAEDFVGKPCVTGADGALLLIRVTFAPRNDRWKFTDMFLYRAGPGEPSLYLLPRPYPLNILCDHVGVLSCGEHYLVVVPEARFEASGRMVYDLFVFSSETKSWNTIVAPLAVDADTDYDLLLMHYPTKVMSIAGIWLAWIDLRRGVLLCNVIDKLPEMRLIQLPSLLGTNKIAFAPFDGAVPPLRRIRDVSCNGNGLIRFIEIEYPDLDDCNDTEFRWTATIFTREICSENWDWCCTVDSADICPTDTCSHDLFPEIWDCMGKLTLNKVMSSSPTLDLYDDDVLYMMAKLNLHDTTGWVLAINTRNKTLFTVMPFSGEKIFYDPIYQQCSFTHYLGKDQGTHLATALTKCTNRGKIEFLEKYLLAALDQLKDIEIHIESLRQRCCGGMSSFCFDRSSSLDGNIQTVAKYGWNIGRGKDVDVEEYLRLLRDFDLHILAPIGATKGKIRIAHGALYNLMLALPSEVLDEYVE